MPLLDSEDRLLGIQDYLLLAAILFLPWAWGGMETWSYRLAALLIVAAGCVALAAEGLDGFCLDWKKSRWLAPALLLGLWAGLQLVPLPPALIRTLSPETYRTYEAFLPAYPSPAESATPMAALEHKAETRVPEAAGTRRTSDSAPALAVERDACRSNLRPLSLHPDATLERLCWFSALLLAFVLVRRRSADREVLGVYRAALFAMLSLFALVIALRVTSIDVFDRMLAKLEVVRFGLYGNPNHRAGLMELAVPWLAGHAWLQLRRSGRAALIQARFLLCAGAAGISLIACIVSSSKVGVLLVVLSLTALVLLGSRTWRARLLAGGVCLLLVAFGALLLGQSRIGERLESHFGRLQGLELGGTRPTAWKACLQMLSDYPLTGSGFGAFREVFAHYLPPGEFQRWAQAHNDYLEVVLGGGVIAAVLLLWLMAAYGARLCRTAKASIARSGTSWLGLVLGIVSLSLHALVDFNHQMPGTALLFVAMCAIALPLSPTSGAAAARPAGRGVGRRLSVLLLSALLLSVFGYRAASGIVARASLSRSEDLDHAAQEGRALVALQRAKVGDDRVDNLRRMVDIRLELYDRQDRLGSADVQLLADSAGDSIEYLCRCPAAWRPWSGLGRVYGRLESARLAASGEEGVGDSWSDVGRAGIISVGMYRMAIERAKHWYENYDRLAIALGSYGLEQEALVVVEESARVMPLYWRHRYAADEVPPLPFQEAFLAGARGALGKTPFLTRMDHLIVLGRLESTWGDPQRAIESLENALRAIGDAQDRAEANYLLGVALRQAGQLERARTHLELAGQHSVFEEAALGSLAELALHQEQPERALELLQRLRWMDSSNVDLCLQYAAVASKLEEWPAALEALKWAGIVDPQDVRSRVALIETYIAMGDAQAALSLLGDLEKEGGAAEDVARLRQVLDARATSPQHSGTSRSAL